MQIRKRIQIWVRLSFLKARINQIYKIYENKLKQVREWSTDIDSFNVSKIEISTIKAASADKGFRKTFAIT